MNTKEKYTKLIEDLETRPPLPSAEQMLKFYISNFPETIALSSSMSAEDQVLTDMIFRITPSTRIFTLDTGRLPEETYDLIERTQEKYGITIEVLFPGRTEVEEMVSKSGPNLFYKSIESRKECCRVRKIEPLKRALKNLDVWICGLRKEQSITRSDLEPFGWDEQFGLIKILPLLKWTNDDVWDYIRKNDVPYNTLHDKGYPSIGCEPCTRAISEGQDIRAGRWWWESPEHKECGLHLNKTVTERSEES